MLDPPAAEPATRRLFFALWPPDELRQRIEHSTRNAVRSAGGRVIPASNFHVTVLFIGQVRQSQLASVIAAADSITGSPFDLSLSTLESWKKAGVLVLLDQHTPPALEVLAERLQNNLLSIQLKLKRQVLRPHVTLVRKPERVVPSQKLPVLEWPVAEFVLVDSQTTRAGSHYTVMGRWPLA